MIGVLDRAALIFFFLCAVSGAAQTIDYACIPRFRADPAVIRISEASGGQVLLLSPQEIADPAIARAQPGFNDQTILRASGTLSGRVHEFTAPVERGVRSLQFTVFAECVKTVTVMAPSGREVEGARFSSGRIVMVDGPEPGAWKVRLSGTGYYSAIAQAKGAIALALPRFDPAGGKIEAHLGGEFDSAQFLLLARDGSVVRPVHLERSGSDFRGALAAPDEPFRIGVEGKDAAGFAFRRVHPALFGTR
jgi:hypothetical protein